MQDLAMDGTSTKRLDVPKTVSRVTSLDLVRGVAMLLMAIDHVRVYSGIPAGGTTFGVFFTRWITNFVAPTFVFLAGTSAYLYGRRFQSRAPLSKFLAARGVWLILLELTILRVAWTFNFDFRNYLLGGVIWMIGWSMIALSAAVYLPSTIIGILGVAVIVLHNITNLLGAEISQAFGSAGPNFLFKILYFGGASQLGQSGPKLFILYVLIPWVGLMFAGYAFGPITEKASGLRRRIYLGLGIGLTALFLALRLTGEYGDPRPWDRHSLFGFLNTTKYPASFEYIVMTLGPMFLLWAFAERWKGRFASVIETFGRAPLFYYLLHIPLIHIAACLVSLVREGHIDPWLFANHPLIPGPVPPGYEWSLGLLYFVYAISVAGLYFACRWYVRIKRTSQSAWLRFL